MMVHQPVRSPGVPDLDLGDVVATIDCPACGFAVPWNEDRRGGPLSCPRCQREFLPPGTAREAALAPPAHAPELTLAEAGLRRTEEEAREFLAIAVDLGFFPRETTQGCLEAWRARRRTAERSPDFGKFLVERGMLTPEQSARVEQARYESQGPPPRGPFAEHPLAALLTAALFVAYVYLRLGLAGAAAAGGVGLALVLAFLVVRKRVQATFLAREQEARARIQGTASEKRAMLPAPAEVRARLRAVAEWAGKSAGAAPAIQGNSVHWARRGYPFCCEESRIEFRPWTVLSVKVAHSLRYPVQVRPRDGEVPFRKLPDTCSQPTGVPEFDHSFEIRIGGFAITGCRITSYSSMKAANVRPT